MKQMDIKNRIYKLRDEVSRLRSLYHNENTPNVTDDVYESLLRELNELENKYPKYKEKNEALNRVAGKPLPYFEKVKHEIRMLSLNDAFSYEDIILWDNRNKKLLGNNSIENYFCEVKLDGLSASLTYIDGKFFKGATRGDGFVGEDITENLKMINSIPLLLNGNIKGIIEVRGEIVMTKKSWQKLNKNQEKNKLAPFANTRNAAAGSIRQLNSSIVKERNLDFFAWDIAQYTKNIVSHSIKHSILRDLGFIVTPYEKKAKNLEEVYKYIEKIGKEREDFPYGTDGMVISIDEINSQEILGFVGKAPRYMIAFKYPAERATTIVKDITINVGRTGAMTPLAHFNKTLVAGSIISKATLHNMDQINRLDIRVGDTVVIQKAGDVIPEIVEVLFKMRNGTEKKFKMPLFCPSCNSKIEKKENDTTNKKVEESVAYYCKNISCGARSRRGMQHFVNIFEIDEIGPKILDRLKDEGLITDAADLFKLEVLDLSGLERFGLKSAENIIKSIENHKKIDLWRFIYALGIIHVGEETSRDLANRFENITNLMNANLSDFNSIDNIGPSVSNSINKYFENINNINFIKKLLENGVLINHKKNKNGILTGKVFVLTGTLESFSREIAKKRIIEKGGSVLSAVSNKTNYLLCGLNPGSKYKEAVKLGIRIINENEFSELLSK